MTEDEAKTKWCPMAQVTVGNDAYHAMNNREEPIVRDTPQGSCTRCIASACMAWTWSEEKRTAAFLEAVQAVMMTQAAPNFNTATRAVWKDTGGKFARTEGRCGLAAQ